MGSPEGLRPFLQEKLQPPGLVKAVWNQIKKKKKTPTNAAFKLDRKRLRVMSTEREWLTATEIGGTEAQ